MKPYALFAAFFLFSAAAFAQPCSDLFFSEYVEGTSNNKALEIYNPTPDTVNLAPYTVQVYNNGAATPTNAQPLAGLLAPYEVFIIANFNADSIILAMADTTSWVGAFNGDDAIVLLNGTDTLDIIGQVGVDPGINWPVDTGATSEYTLVRKNTTGQGQLLWAGAGDTEWDVYAQNDFTHLGSHAMLMPSAAFTWSAVNTTVTFTDASANAAGWAWNFGDGSPLDSTQYPVHIFPADSTWWVCLVMWAATGCTDTFCDSVTVLTIGMEEAGAGGGFAVYPSPTKGEFTVLSFKFPVQMEVLDIYGRQIANFKLITGNSKLSLQGFSPGTYLLRITAGGRVHTEKLVLMR